MQQAHKADSRQLHIAYLLTTFPCASETFVQRELRMLAAREDIRLDIHSLWQGGSQWENRPVYQFPASAFLRVVPRLCRLLPSYPRIMQQMMSTVLSHPAAATQNTLETLAGLGSGIVLTSGFRKNPPSWIHAGWATMPASAAWVLHKLTGIPYSMGAHAYDIFLWGGDCLLRPKIKDASFIHTTTEYARQRLLQLGAMPEQVQVIRRGLDRFPQFLPPRKGRSPLRLISAGRFVEKKGWIEQLAILHACKQAGLNFTARIVGRGPMENDIRREHRRLGLEDRVSVESWLSPQQLVAAWAEADVCLFTGKVAANGDRDGLPNVLPEAMAGGVLIVATAVAGVPEAISHETTGFLCPLHEPGSWIRTLQRIQTDDSLCKRLADNALAWVLEHYDNARNTTLLVNELQQRAAEAAGKNMPK